MTHGSFIEALKAVLDDLGHAHKLGAHRDCDVLIDAMNELRVLCDKAPVTSRTEYSVTWTHAPGAHQRAA